MKRILNLNVIDIVPFSAGLIFVKSDKNEDGVSKVSFFSYDANSGEITTVTPSSSIAGT